MLDGRAGDDLLDTYEAERLPVARMTVEQAYTRYVTRLDPGLGTDGLEPVIDDAAIDLGYRYRSRSIVEDGPDDGAPWDDPRAPSGRPGVRAPHVTLRRDGTELSTLDLIGRDAVLFTGPDGTAWVRAAAVASGRLGVSVDVCRVGEGGDVGDPQGEFAKVYGLGPGGATLVRPDGVVAWRAREAVDDASDAISAAVAHTLCRSG